MMIGPVLSPVGTPEPLALAAGPVSGSPADYARTILVCADVAHQFTVVTPNEGGGGMMLLSGGSYMPANYPYLLNVGAGSYVVLTASGVGNATLTDVKLSS